MVEWFAEKARLDLAAEPLCLVEPHRLADGGEAEPAAVRLHLVYALAVGRLGLDVDAVVPVEGRRLGLEVDVEPEHADWIWWRGLKNVCAYLRLQTCSAEAAMPSGVRPNSLRNESAFLLDPP